MSWNYRIGTKWYVYPETLVKIGKPGERVFSIIECYYDKKLKPNGYIERCALSNWDNLKDLLGTYKLIAGAFKKPILDLDNFPKIYKSKKKKKKK